MINDPFAILTTLLLIEGLILLLADWPPLAKVFKYVPSMFWIYFLPMCVATAGLLPPEKVVVDGKEQMLTPIYGIIRTYCLPASLVLLLVSVDIRAILRLGPIALGVMLAGVLGIMAGGPVVLAMFGGWLPEDAWKGVGALSASWVGGSANMVAVASGLDTPIGPMVVVDTIVPYTWMGLMILMSSWQHAFDRWNRTKAGVLEAVAHAAGSVQQVSSPISLRTAGAMFALAAGATLASQLAAGGAMSGTVAMAQAVPSLAGLKGMLNVSAWTIILATTLGILLSFTPARKLEAAGASKVGYFLLFLVLASIGAQTTLAHIAAAPILIVAGFVWIAIHAGFLLAAGRLLRAPMSLLAASSQACVGGPASAPVVAGIYQPGLAPVGLLLAVLGNIMGTYTGFICARMCHAVAVSLGYCPQ